MKKLADWRLLILAAPISMVFSCDRAASTTAAEENQTAEDERSVRIENNYGEKIISACSDNSMVVFLITSRFLRTTELKYVDATISAFERGPGKYIGRPLLQVISKSSDGSVLAATDDEAGRFLAILMANERVQVLIDERNGGQIDEVFYLSNYERKRLQDIVASCH